MDDTLPLIDRIDNYNLIKEMKIRPCLYDQDHKDYKDIYLRKRNWEEVSRKLFASTWDQLTEIEHQHLVREVQKRWKNLRTCFHREIRYRKLTAKKPCIKRKKYVYYDRLLFLRPTIEDIEPESGDESIEDSSKSAVLNKKNPNQKSIGSSTGAHHSAKRAERENIAQIQEPQHKLRFEENDSITNFALSLVPFLKEVPTASLIDCEIEILRTLKAYRYYSPEEYLNDIDGEVKVDPGELKMS